MGNVKVIISVDEKTKMIDFKLTKEGNPPESAINIAQQMVQLFAKENNLEIEVRRPQ